MSTILHTWPWCGYCRCYGCPHTTPPDEGVVTTTNRLQLLPQGEPE